MKLDMSIGNFNFVEIGTNRTDERLRRISVLLTILALLALSHSILYAKLEIGYWGLVNSLPITFFVALALLVIASALLWVSKEKHTKLLGLQLVTIILALALVPVITGGSIPFINHGYRNVGYVDHIVRQGHFDTQLTFYLSWPGAFVLGAIINILCQIDFTPLIEILPFLLPVLFIIPLYIFLKNILGQSRSKYVWAGCLIFSAAGGGGGNLISAGGTAAFLLLVILALVTNRRLWHKEGNPFPIILLIVIAFTAMVVCHMLTSLATLAMIAVLALVRRDRYLILTAVVSFAVLLAWNLTVAGNFIMPRLPFVGEGGLIFDFSLLFEREVTGHFQGSGAHINVAMFRIIHTVIFLLLGFAGFISSLVVRRELKTTISLAAITVITIPLVALSGYYAREIITRIYGFIMPGLAYFGTRLFDINKKVIAAVLCLLLIIAIPIELVVNYGNQELDYISPGQLAGTFFFHDNVSQGIIYGSWPMGKVKNIEHYVGSELDNLIWYNNRLDIHPWLRKYESYYISISRQNRAHYGWYQGNTEFIDNLEQQIHNTVGINFIYYNPDMQLYIYKIDGANEGG
jgi:hypothetical protein